MAPQDGNPAKTWAKRRAAVTGRSGRTGRAVPLALIVLVAGLLPAVVVAAGWIGLQRAEREDRFDAEVSQAQRQVVAELARHEQALRATAGLFAADGRVDRAEFERFAATLDLERSFPGIDGLTFISSVPRGSERVFEATQRKLGAPGFRIAEASITRSSRGPSRERFVTTFAAPEANWSSIGYDLSSLPSARYMLEQARDSGRPRLTPRFTPFVDRDAPSKKDGFVLLLPVYRDGSQPPSVAGRRAALEGWVAMRFLGDRFLSRVIDSSLEPIRWKLFDGPTPAAENQLATDVRPGEADEGLSTVRTFAAGGRTWSLRAQALRGFVRSSDRAGPPLMFGGGLLLALLLSALVWALSRSKTRAETLVERATRTLRDNERRFRTLAASSPVGIFHEDADGRSVYANARFREIFGLGAEEELDLARVRTIDPEDGEAVERAWQTAREGGTEVSVRFRVSAPGRQRWVHSRAAAVLDDHGGVRGFVGSVEDITERQAFEAQLTHQALHDPLTGLPNRVLFMDRIDQAIARARRSPTVVAVMFLDLDRFKLVNDSYGHDVGDELLRLMAGRLASSIRPGDTVARFGGDEFTVLCEVKEAREAVELAERLVKAVERPCFSRSASS